MIKSAILMLLVLAGLGLAARGGELWRRFKRNLRRGEQARLNALCPRCGRMRTGTTPCGCDRGRR